MKVSKETAAVLVGVLALLLAAVILSVQPGPHHFPECADCHQIRPSGEVDGRRLAASVSDICNRCHRRIFEQYSHPVDVTPVKTVTPADLPLSPQGTVTCATCHDIHGRSQHTDGTPTRFLRRPVTGSAFCAACHEQRKPGARGHAETLGEPHFPGRYIVTDASVEIDALSKNCITCHDGSFAASATVMAGVWVHGRDFLKHDRGSHPIGIDYEAARQNRGRKTDLRPAAAVDVRIRFFGGKVGCGTCHDPFSTIEKKLVMSDRQSALCFACHVIDT